MRELGHECELVGPCRWPWNPAARKNNLYRGIDPLRALWTLLFRRKVDAVVSVFESSGLFVLLLRRLFFFRPKVLLWDASLGSEWRPLKMVHSATLPRYDGFMMLTSSQSEKLREIVPADRDVATIFYQVDESFYSPGANDREEYILSVGDDDSRDYATLFEAIRPLDAKSLLKTAWRPDVAKESWPSGLVFESTRLDREAFRELYRNATIVVLPLRPQNALTGGITALFEAMSQGKPIIVSDSPMIRDFIVDGENGLVVPSGDPLAMRAAIERLLGDGALRAKLAAGARATIVEHFSTARLAERMAEAIEKMTRSERKKN